MKPLIALTCALALYVPLSQADMPQTPETTTSISTLLDIQHNWAKANYQLRDDDQVAAFEALLKDAKALSDNDPLKADNWIWLGITQSTFAGVKGGLGALSLAEDAKKSLEKALEINPDALQGSAYTSLGTLYHKVPGWPIGFGSDKTAKEMLQKALEINPEGIDPNYFYGEFLYDKRKYKAAKKYLLKAQNAQGRPDRPIADSGRQQEIKDLLAKIERKMD